MSTFAQPQQGQQEQPSEVVSGTVTQIVTKPNEKWVIEVTPDGSQYSKNCWTKDFGLVQQMGNAIGQAFDFVCRRNHYQGPSGPTSSLWINSVALYGSTPVGEMQIPGTGQVHTPAAPLNAQGAVIQQPVIQGTPSLSPMEKETRIMREAAMKVAAHMLPYMKPEERSLPGMVTVAEGLIRYYQQGPDVVNGRPGDDPTPTQRNIQSELGELVEQGVLVEDTGGDDIPF